MRILSEFIRVFSVVFGNVHCLKQPAAHATILGMSSGLARPQPSYATTVRMVLRGCMSWLRASRPRWHDPQQRPQVPPRLTDTFSSVPSKSSSRQLIVELFKPSHTLTQSDSLTIEFFHDNISIVKVASYIASVIIASRIIVLSPTIVSKFGCHICDVLGIEVIGVLPLFASM